MMQLVVFVLCLVSFACLMLGMPKHYAFVTQTTLGYSQQRVLRGAGWLVLLLAAWVAVWQWPWDEGLVVWLGWLSVVGVALVFCLPYWPWQAQAKKRLSSRKAKAVVGWVEQRDTQQRGCRDRLPIVGYRVAPPNLPAPCGWARPCPALLWRSLYR